MKPTSGLAALLAKDLEGVPDYPAVAGSSDRHQNQAPSTHRTASAVPTNVDEVESFSQRYPSLSGIEMVETEIEGSGGETRMMRMKEI